MRAAQYLAPKRIEAIEIEMPSLGEEEALIQVEACGMCGSDLGIYAGVHPRARAPLTIGHEFSGSISEIRSTTSDLKSGQRIAAFPLITCGNCLMCRTGNSHVCRNLRLFGIDAAGGMAQFVKLPVTALMPIGEMNAQMGALVEPLAVAVHGVSRAPIAEARTIAVVGAGPIGLLTALVAQTRTKVEVIIADVLESRVALATKLGLNALRAGEEFAEAIQERTGGEGADLVFECAGVSETAKSMISLTRCRGTVVNLGVFKKPTEADLQTLNFREITLLGSRVYTRRDFETAIQLAPDLPLMPIVTNFFPLNDVSTAFERFQAGAGVCKILILPGS